MNQAPYIPSQDAQFDAWLANFSTLLTTAPATYGMTAPDAATVQAAYDSWHPVYIESITPETRTTPVIAQKDAERASAEATVRPYAIRISLNAAVTPQSKEDIGVNQPNRSPVPIPPPTTFPQLSLDGGSPLQHRLRYQDSGLGTGKAKPFGAIALELWSSVGTVAATDPAQCSYVASYTKAPLRVNFVASQQGKICTYFGRWVTRSGAGGVAQVGPWSPPLTAIVM